MHERKAVAKGRTIAPDAVCCSGAMIPKGKSFRLFALHELVPIKNATQQAVLFHFAQE
jgi:hypothetical protein